MAKKKLQDVKGFSFFLKNDSVGALVAKCVLMLAIPYAYLMLCGLIFDRLLRWYFMTTFIFFSLIALYVVALVFVVLAVKYYLADSKKREKVKQ